MLDNLIDNQLYIESLCVFLLDDMETQWGGGHPGFGCVYQ